MADLSDSSPGLLQQIIDRLRAIHGTDPGMGQMTELERRRREAATGHRLPVSNMDEVDRMAAGLPPIQR